MVRPDKVEFVRSLADKIKGAQSVILADFKGLTVGEITGLRSSLRERNVEFRVIKNRLARLALAEAGCEPINEVLTGNTAWAFGVDDPAEPAKILADFAKENEKLVIKGGLLEFKAIDVATVQDLAKLPSRPELLGMMARGLMQPAAKVASVMEAGLIKIALGFIALAEKLENESGAPAAS